MNVIVKNATNLQATQTQIHNVTPAETPKYLKKTIIVHYSR